MALSVAPVQPLAEGRSPDGARVPYLSLKNVSKSFGAFQALRDVSLEILEGEFICFLGPSGCGKTTLLRVVAGLDPQTSGTVQQGGRDISSLPPAERDFGIVFQSYALFPNLSAGANVLYGVPRSKEENGRRLQELLELVGLPDAATKYPAQLSGGQQQRIAVARAIATSPGLLLLDEPLSALDARVRLHLRRHLKHLQKQLGITTIMVTHDQEEALTMADRIVLMNEGTVEQVGTPFEVYTEPATPFVADFVGHMNLLQGTACSSSMVQIGDLKLEVATDIASSLAGKSVSVAIRPEDVVVRDTLRSAPNTFDASIENLDFLGSYYRADLSLSGTTQKCAAQFSVNAVRDLSLSVGQRRLFCLPRARLRVFDA
jgi:iron(III) transport system ATP-binding protein